MSCLPPNAVYLMLVGAAIGLVVAWVMVLCALLISHVGSRKREGGQG